MLKDVENVMVENRYRQRSGTLMQCETVAARSRPRQSAIADVRHEGSIRLAYHTPLEP
jgi:hypothetical protein